jgi:hypothetical protein
LADASRPKEYPWHVQPETSNFLCVMNRRFSFEAMGPTFPRAEMLIKVYRKLSKFVEMYMRDIRVTFNGGLLHRRCNHSNLVVCPFKPCCDAALPNRTNYLLMSGHNCETEILAAFGTLSQPDVITLVFITPTVYAICKATCSVSNGIII